MRIKARTLDKIADERQVLFAELTGMESTLKAISEDIAEFRAKLTQNYIQEQNIRKASDKLLFFDHF